MAATYDAVSTADTGGSDSTSLSIAAPAGLAAGEVMYALINVNAVTGLTAPAGWTEIGEDGHFGSGISGGSFLYRKIATADDIGATFTWTKTLAQKWHGAIISVAGASPTTPEIASVTTNNGGTAGTAAVTGTNPAAESGQLVVDFYGALSNVAGVPTFTAGSGTERADAGDGSRGGLQIVTGATSAPGVAGASTVSTASAWSSFRVVVGPRYWETPSAPVLGGPSGGESVVIDDDIDLVGVHQHPDSGDVQSAAEERYRVVGAGSWTTVAIATAATTITLPGGTLVAGSYERQRRTASSLGKWGPWSASEFFEAIPLPDPPTIVTPADGATVGAEELATFTLAATATSFTWRRVADVAGVPDTGVVYDEETVLGNGREFTVTFDVTGRAEHLQVSAVVSGFDTGWASHVVNVTFTPPTDPTHTASTVATDGAITIAIANPVPVVPALVGTGTDATGAGVGGQKRQAILASGRRVAVRATTGTNAAFHWSDDGENWTDYGSDIAGWANGSIGVPYVDSGGVERLVVCWMQSGTGGGRTDLKIYVMVGTFNAARTTLTWGTAATTGNLTNPDHFPDIVALAEGTGGYFHMVRSRNNGGFSFTLGARAAINSSGVIGAITDNIVLGGDYGAGRPDTYPTIIVLPSKKLFAAWSGGTTGSGKGTRGKFAAYAAGVWTWGTERELDSTRYVDAAGRWLRARYDGTRVVVIGEVYDGANYDIVAWDRDVADTTTTPNVLANDVSADDRLDYGTAAVDTATGDIYVAGHNSSFGGDHVAYRKWTRAGATLGALVDIVDVENAAPYLDLEWSAGDLLALFLSGAASPYDLLSASVLDLVPGEAADHNNVWRREVGDVGTGLRVAADIDVDGTFTDWFVAPRIVYEYRVEAVAANGASTFDDWAS